MKIKQVHAHFLISIGNYSNERIGFTVELSEQDEAEEIADIVNQLREKAKKIVGQPADDLYERKWQAEAACKEIEHRLNKLRKEWDATAEFLKAQGINAQAPSMPQFAALLTASQKIEEEIIAEFDE